MLLDVKNSVASIVQSDYRSADVFKKWGINYCCSGQVSLEEACGVRAIELDTIVKEIEEATRTIQLSNTLSFDKWKTEFLVDYIVNVHHAYLQEVLPSLEARLVSFIEGHKKKHPELLQVLEVFQQLAAVLRIHNRLEEETIFPYIKQIDAAHRRNEPYGSLLVRTLRKPLSNVKKEHGEIASLLQQLSSITNRYTFPEKACTNHQVIYHKLLEFHNDLVQHKHLENNILLPRAIEIEQQLLEVNHP
jgi:regulator of cell morphogenesis and NO signaling